jgi:very-short-patch-repair endonuclease
MSNELTQPKTSHLPKGRTKEGFKRLMTKHYNKISEKGKRRTLRKEMTYCEKIMWIHLRRKQLGVRFLRQYSVDQFIIDFYSPEIKFAVELDGNIHNDPDQKEYNIKRQEYLENFGIIFLRITNDELMGNANMAFDKIKEVIKNRKQKLTPPKTSPLPKGRTKEGFKIIK